MDAIVMAVVCTFGAVIFLALWLILALCHAAAAGDREMGVRDG